MQMIGFKDVNFHTKEGQHIIGFKIYYNYELSGEDGYGLGCESVFCAQHKIVGNLHPDSIGNQIDIRYNRFGKVDKIIIL